MPLVLLFCRRPLYNVVQEGAGMRGRLHLLLRWQFWFCERETERTVVVSSDKVSLWCDARKSFGPLKRGKGSQAATPELMGKLLFANPVSEHEEKGRCHTVEFLRPSRTSHNGESPVSHSGEKSQLLSYWRKKWWNNCTLQHLRL